MASPPVRPFYLSNLASLYPWLIGYALLDVAYVVASRSVYMSRVVAISGDSGAPETGKLIVCAVLVYAVLAAGWALIAAPAAKDALKGAKAGALYGLVLYGVFNLTTGAMFREWTFAIMARDTLWGAGSLAAVTAAYGATVAAQ